MNKTYRLLSIAASTCGLMFAARVDSARDTEHLNAALMEAIPWPAVVSLWPHRPRLAHSALKHVKGSTRSGCRRFFDYVTAASASPNRLLLQYWRQGAAINPGIAQIDFQLRRPRQ